MNKNNDYKVHTPDEKWREWTAPSMEMLHWLDSHIVGPKFTHECEIHGVKVRIYDYNLDDGRAVKELVNTSNDLTMFVEIIE